MKELKEKYLNAVADYETTMFEKEQLNSLVNSCQEEIRQLKKQLKEYKLITIDYQELEARNKELKKQLENKYEKVGTLTGELLYEENTKLINQQKEFIEYMNKTIEDCNNYSKYIEKKTKELHGRSCGKTYIANEIMKNEVAKKILKEILSKYKEIIGDDK